jgi:predicted nuclease of restriction endonuclease-like (RecB) superfamily
MNKPLLPPDYAVLLKEIKDRIAQAQTRAVLSVNAELVRLYWDIGRLIDSRKRQEGWGAAVIPRLPRELKNELPELKGFSERTIDRMIAFFQAYPRPPDFSPPPVAKFPPPLESPQAVAKSSVLRKVPQPAAQIPSSLLWSIPWAHHVVLMEKVKDEATRLWHMEQTLANGWSRNVLMLMVRSDAHCRQGKALTNFDRLLPAPLPPRAGFRGD